MEYRIIFISALDIWSIEEGKGAPSFYNTLKLYIDKGHKVTLIKPTSKKRLECKIPGLKTVTFENGKADQLCTIKKISFFARIVTSARMTRKFYKIGKSEILKSNIPCVLYAYEVHSVKAAKRLSLKFGVPVITRFQGTILDNCQNTLINRLKKYPHFEALHEKSNLVIMTDDGTNGTTVLKKLGNETEQIFFWRNGVSVTQTSSFETIQKYREEIRNQLNISKFEFVLLTLSRLTEWKRIDRAIDAMPFVLKKFPSCKLVIVGEGNLKAELEKLVTERNLSANVIFAGGVNQSDTIKYYAMADIFLSLYDLSNVGNPLYEALISGKPIITLDNGETSSVIRNEYNGLLLPVDKPLLIQESIISLIDNWVLRDRLSRNALEFSKNHLSTWDERMEKEYHVVSRVVGEFYNNI